VNQKLEMKVLQGQMNPHFIFNSLNAIQYFVNLDQKQHAMAYLSAFTRFMRQLLQDAFGTCMVIQFPMRTLED
jgi:LytS/YehU family sensor histidine kinase